MLHGYFYSHHRLDTTTSNLITFTTTALLVMASAAESLAPSSSTTQPLVAASATSSPQPLQPPTPDFSGYNASLIFPALQGNYMWSKSNIYNSVLWTQTVLEPFIVILGILGNVLATLTLLSPRLRTTSCCLYLAAKCVGDSVFLLALSVVWLYRVDAPQLLNTQGVCQVTVFLSSACSFTSVWLIVFVSHENFVRIARTHQVKTVCTRRRAFTNIALVYILAAVIYNCHLWTSRVLLDAEGQDPMCMSLSRYRRLLVSVSVLDLVATLVLPVLAVLTIMAVTVVTVVRAVQRHRRLNQGLTRETSRKHGENSASKTNNDGRYHAVPNTNNDKEKARKKRPVSGPHGMLEMKVARFLTIVTLTLIVLSSPSHALRLKMVITSYLTAGRSEPETDESGASLPSTVDATLQRAFEVVYYLSFSGNLFIFLAAGHNFRRIFVQQMRAHTLRVCLFFRRVGCVDEEVKGQEDTPGVAEGGEEGQEDTTGEKSVQSCGSKSDKLFRKQSFSQRCISWLSGEDARRGRGGPGRDAELSRGAFTSLELLASSCIEMENLGLDLAGCDRGSVDVAVQDTAAGGGSEMEKDPEIKNAVTEQHAERALSE